MSVEKIKSRGVKGFLVLPTILQQKGGGRLMTVKEGSRPFEERDRPFFLVAEKVENRLRQAGIKVAGCYFTQSKWARAYIEFYTPIPSCEKRQFSTFYVDLEDPDKPDDGTDFMLHLGKWDPPIQLDYDKALEHVAGCYFWFFDQQSSSDLNQILKLFHSHGAEFWLNRLAELHTQLNPMGSRA